MGIQFQSSFYFQDPVNEFDINLNPSDFVAYQPKKKKKIVTSQSVYVRNDESTYDTSKDLLKSPYLNKMARIKQPDVEKYDDTGYKTLQLEEDSFLEKINIIKKHLERDDHPITQFISCFDYEFSEYYMIFLANESSKHSK